MKSLGDAIALRNPLIEHLEEADTECAANDREPLLTFVVAGGGFAGVETVGSIMDQNDAYHLRLKVRIKREGISRRPHSTRQGRAKCWPTILSPVFAART